MDTETMAAAKTLFIAMTPVFAKHPQEMVLLSKLTPEEFKEIAMMVLFEMVGGSQKVFLMTDADFVEIEEMFRNGPFNVCIFLNKKLTWKQAFMCFKYAQTLEFPHDKVKNAFLASIEAAAFAEENQNRSRIILPY